MVVAILETPWTTEEVLQHCAVFDVYRTRRKVIYSLLNVSLGEKPPESEIGHEGVAAKVVGGTIKYICHRGTERTTHLRESITGY